MSLSSVPGQERARGQIAAWFGADRLPQTILITGKAGVGKRRLALELARALLCRRRPGEGCDDCPACTKSAALAHPDLHVLLPLPTGTSRSGTDAEQFAALRETALDYLNEGGRVRAGGNIPKEHVLLLQREMSFAPTEAPRRVAIIFEADRMHAAGSNSLLKILEEPPRHAVFLLVAAHTDRLLPTVVSRCQRLALRALTSQEVQDLASAGGADAGRAELAARLASGTGLRAERVMDEDFEALREAVEGFIESGLAAREADYWALLESIGGRPDKQWMEGFLELCSAYLRDLFLLQMARPEGVANVDRRASLEAWSARLDGRRLEGIARSLDEAFEGQTRNLNPQLLLADLWNQLRRGAA